MRHLALKLRQLAKNGTIIIQSVLQIQIDKSKEQVSLAIRGGYVPEKFRTANTKTAILSLK